MRNPGRTPVAGTLATVAAIDVGSSAVRLSVAHVTAVGTPKPFVQQRLPLRLGSEVFAGAGGGAVSPASLQALLDVLRKLRDLSRHNGAVHLRAVATSALREAKNAEDVCAQVQRVLGFRLEVLDGVAESVLSREALAAALSAQGCQVPEAERLYIDLGGGSLELAGGSGAFSTSLPLGTVRLLAAVPGLGQAAPAPRPGALEGAGVPLAELVAAVAGRLDAALRPWSSALGGPRGAAPGAAKGTRWTLVGTGGNLEAMAQLAPAPAGTPGRQVALAALWPLAERVADMPLAVRAQKLGLRPDRADLALPALLVVHALAERTRAAALWVPGSGLRDGLLAELAAQVRLGTAPKNVL